MVVTNVKLENFSGGAKHLFAPYTNIVIPAYATGDNAVTGQIPAAIAVDVLAAFVETRSMVSYEILGEEDDGRETDLVDGNIVLSPQLVDGGEL
jgi:hypothetical protein